MSMRNALLKLAIVGAVAASFAPRAAHAQTANAGQLVSAVQKLHQAQLAFIKKLADDPTYAQQFETATVNGNYDAAAGLASIASGLPKGSIHVGRGSSASGISNPGSTSAGTTLVRYASLTGKENASASMSGSYLCFDFGVIYGCLSFK